MENTNKVIIGLLITACVLSGITFGMFYFGRSNPLFLMTNNQSPIEPITLSGIYQGNYFFDRNAIVPEGNNVTLINGEFTGGPIYVYGNITIQNCLFDHELIILERANAGIHNITFKYGAQIRTHGNSSCFVEKIYYYNNITYAIYPLLSTFDYSTVSINNSVVDSKAFGYSQINFTNIQNYTDLASKLDFYDNAEGFIYNSTVYQVTLGTQQYPYITPKPLVKLNNTNISYMWTEGNSTGYLLQSSTIYQYVGYHNTILYNESSTTINETVLFNNAKIISI